MEKLESLETGKIQEQEKVGYRNPPKKYQWKPGQSGNLKGRPPSITAEIRKDLKRGKLKEVKKKIWELVAKNKWDTLKTVWEYTDGKPKETHEIISEDLREVSSLLRDILDKK